MARLSERCVCGANFLADTGPSHVDLLKEWRQHWLDTHRCLEYAAGINAEAAETAADLQIRTAERMPQAPKTDAAAPTKAPKANSASEPAVGEPVAPGKTQTARADN